MSKQHLRPSGLHHNPAYSHVVVASGARTIYISGQVSTDDEGRVVGEGDLAAQTTQVMHNLGPGAESCRRELFQYREDHHLCRRLQAGAPSHHRQGALGSSLKAWSPRRARWSAVTALAAPEWLIEIEAVAVVTFCGRLRHCEERSDEAIHLSAR
jgi:enamine deaminase RidA (YjgF/YER057c/UK114 family)